MKIVSFKQPLPVEDAKCFLDLERDRPAPRPREVLGQIPTVPVKPADTGTDQLGFSEFSHDATQTKQTS